MARLLHHHALAGPDRPALIDEQGVTTWRQLDDRVDRLVGALHSLGLRQGDRLALLSGNRAEFFETVLAALHGGLVIVPINWHCTADEIAYVLDNSGARAIVIDHRFETLADDAIARTDGTASPTRILVGPGGDYEHLIASAQPSDAAEQVAGTVMFYTSGTTGRPKGVKGWFSQVGAPPESIAEMAKGFIALLGIDATATSLLCGPAYHTAQFFWSLFPLTVGGTVLMRHRFDAEETLRLIDEHRIANVHMVPTQFIRLLRLSEDVRSSFDGSSLAMVLHGSAPCPPHVKRDMIDWWGPIIAEYYGATEGGVTHLIRAAEWVERPGSVGRTLPIFETIVTDVEGVRLAPNQTGDLWFRHLAGRDFEYFGDPEKTRSAHLEPGVFTFGDIGWVDDEGFLYLADRKADLIIAGGVNIYPAEVEAALAEHPAVADAAVFGVPDDEYGETVKAVVELVDGIEPSDAIGDEILAFCRTKIAGFKVPRSIDFEVELPRQASGKLLKRQLRDRYWADAGRLI